MLQLKRTRTTSDSESTEPPIVVQIEESSVHHASQDNLNATKAFVLCFTWCTLSVFNNIISKSLLNSFPYPLTSTFSQLLSTSICAGVIVRVWEIPKIHSEIVDRRYFIINIVPLGFGKFLAACGTHISVSLLSVSYAHTVKASMPIFVVFLSSIFFKERYSVKIYFSLFIIFFGVGLASLTELEFNMTGLFAALISTAAFAFMNILTKKCLNDTHMHHFRLLFILAWIGTIMFFPFWFYLDGLHFIYTDKPLSSQYSMLFTLILLVADGVMNFSQNLIAFTLIAKVTPVSYAVCNVIKRIAVIVMSILFFGNPVTYLNVFGTLSSMTGVFLYNMVKNQHKKAHLPSLKPQSMKTYRPEYHQLSTSHDANTCRVFMGDPTYGEVVPSVNNSNWSDNNQRSYSQKNKLGDLKSGNSFYLTDQEKHLKRSKTESNTSGKGLSSTDAHLRSSETHVSSRYGHRGLVSIPSGVELNLNYNPDNNHIPVSSLVLT